MPYITHKFQNASEPAITLTPHLSMGLKELRNTQLSCYGVMGLAVGAAFFNPIITIPVAALTIVNEGFQYLLKANHNKLMRQHDTITLTGNRLIISYYQPHANRTTTVELDAAWAKAEKGYDPVAIEANHRERVVIASRDKKYALGEFLPLEEQDEVIEEINRVIQNHNTAEL